MHTSPITSLCYDKTGNLYSGGYDGKIIAWERDLQTPKWFVEHDELVNSICCYDDYLYSASADRSVRVWEQSTGKLVKTLIANHSDDLNVVNISKDGQHLVVGGEEGKIWLYDLDGQLIWSLFGGSDQSKSDCIDAVGFLNCHGLSLIVCGDDQGYLNVFGIDGTRLWDSLLDGAIETCVTNDNFFSAYFGLDNGKLVQLQIDAGPKFSIKYIKPHVSAIKALGISRENGSIVTTSYDGDMSVIRLPDLIEESKWQIAGFQRNGWSRSLATDPINGTVLASTSLGGSPQIWDIRVGDLVVPESQKTYGLNAVAVLDGIAYVGGDDGVLYSYYHNELKTHLNVGSMINWLATCTQSNLIAIGTQQGVTLVVCATSFRIIEKFSGDGSPAVTCTFNESGTLVAIASYNGLIRMFDVSSGTAVMLVQAPDTVKAISFGADDGILFAGGADGSLIKIDTARSEILTCVDDLYLVNGLSWAPTSKRLVTVGRDRMIRIWDGDLNSISTSVGHQRSIKAVAWSPDERNFATASYDGHVGIHENGSVTYAVGHDKPGISCVAWLDSNFVASVGWDGTLRVWDKTGNSVSTVFISASAQ